MIREEDWENERRHHEICSYVRIDTFEKYILLHIQKMTSKLQLLNVLERQALLFSGLLFIITSMWSDATLWTLFPKAVRINDAENIPLGHRRRIHLTCI